jgi:molecular chaperone DnaK
MTGYLQFGIDLGTTNSCVARWEGDAVRIFQNNDLMNVTPSAVRQLKTGRMIIGKRAYNAIVDDPANVVIEFKRVMGDKQKFVFPATKREMSPEELSAEVLKALRDDVHRATGEVLNAAVVTVPAAFGTLQCDATARAAHLAGIEQCSLLQEPIAAAIAYGISPEMRDQRWLVYDLGGGTLDIAITSTRDGRLTVLEHRGDNLLGGKDIDRRIVESHLLPALTGQFSLPDAKKEPEQYQLLFRRLAMKAEEAKIELSTRQDVVISLLDIGEDLKGKPIEQEVTLTRADIERAFAPLMERTLQLADQALAGARMTGKDLNRILLVGGPTQMPYLRAALGDHLRAPVDHSLDPMTVVARGAAIYATTVEREQPAAGGADKRAAPGAVSLQLAYEPVSASTEAQVAGKILSGGGAQLEVRIDAQAGYWTSGWVPVNKDYFEVSVNLRQGKICPFYIYVRDQSGQPLDVAPNEFTIRHGLELSAPPLPHTISVEVVRLNGRVELDPIFPRNTPLPTEKRIQYRARHTLRPGEGGTPLVVKLWEGEEISEPEANDWVGNVQITPSMVRRPIPENSELELFIRVDASRLITVEIFVPHLNQHFSEGIYLAEHEQRSDSTTAVTLNNEIVAFTDRLSGVQAHLAENPNTDAEMVLRNLQRSLQDLDIEVAMASQQQALSDPDRARRLVAEARNLRSQVGALERKVGVDRIIAAGTKQAKNTVSAVKETVERYGDTIDRYEFDLACKELDSAAERLDERAVRHSIEKLIKLHFAILQKQDWWWRDTFESMDKTDAAFRNPDAARHWVAEGERAIREGKSAALREAIRQLWTLQTISAADEARQRAAPSGLTL